jgi:hypothetical protein
MKALFKTWATNRKIYLSFLEGYSLEQLNKIPEGFNNNLVWNLGHIVVVQQLLVYRGSNQPMAVSMEMVNKYKPGSKPTEPVTQEEVNQIKELMKSLVAKTEEDYKNGIFTTYNEFTTSTGFHLASVQDALEFNNYHEGMHLGYMMSMRKFI